MVHMVPGVLSRVCTHGGTVRDLAPYPKPQAQLVASSGTGRQQPARNRRPSARPGGAKGGPRPVRVPVRVRCKQRAAKVLEPRAGGLRLIKGGSRWEVAPNLGAISLGPFAFRARISLLKN